MDDGSIDRQGFNTGLYTAENHCSYCPIWIAIRIKGPQDGGRRQFQKNIDYFVDLESQELSPASLDDRRDKTSRCLSGGRGATNFLGSTGNDSCLVSSLIITSLTIKEWEKVTKQPFPKE
jgi:hypothetical protein